MRSRRRAPVSALLILFMAGCSGADRVDNPNASAGSETSEASSSTPTGMTMSTSGSEASTMGETIGVDSETSETPDETGTEAESEAETETETETEAGEGRECEQDCSELDDEYGCGEGKCVEGECVYIAVAESTPCETDGNNDCLRYCYGGECGPSPVNNPCAYMSHGCSLGVCDQGECAIDYCDEFDGQAEFRLNLFSRYFPVPSELEAGAHLLVTSWHFYCDDCESPYYDVVRSLDTGELIAARFVGNAHTNSEVHFDTPFAELAAPFTSIAELDEGLCEPTFLGEDCFSTRLTTRFEHDEGLVASLVEGTRGTVDHYGISTTNGLDYQCDGPPAYRAAYVTRVEDCDGLCAEPTVIDSCVERNLDYPHDRLHVSPDVDFWYPYGGWQLECEIIELVEAVPGDEGTAYEWALDCIDLVLLPGD